MALISAVLKDQQLIEDVERYSDDPEHFHIWWLGQSGYLLLWNGIRILIDPYLSDSLTQKYQHTRKPHVRMSERVIDPRLLKNISIVSSSHNHTDHLDGETLIPMIENNPEIKFIIPEANRAFVSERVRCAPDFPIGVIDGKSVSIGEVIFHGIPSMHNEIERDGRGNCKFMGYVIEFGKWKIYHSGDTLWYPDMAEVLRPFQVDLALLPINGNDPSREVAGNLDTREAAQLAKAIGARMVIPCHYNMFQFNTADPDLFQKEAQSIDQPNVILHHGERWSSSML